MAQSGDYSVRSLAEILQEHGLESEFGTRPGRRRREDEPKADWPARPAPEDQPRSKLRPAPDPSPGTTPPRAAPARAAAPYAEILREQGLESEFGTRPGRRREDEPEPGAPLRAAAEGRGTLRRPAGPAPREAAGRADAPRAVPASDHAAPTAPPRNSPGRKVPARTPAPSVTPVTPAPRPPATPPSPDVPMYGRRSTDAPLPPSLAPGAMPSPSGPSTAAIPALQASRRPAGDGAPATGGAVGEDLAGNRADGPAATGREGVLAWARFAGELVVALAAGIGIYFAFTVLWELLPYAALVAAPLTVTGLVAGVAAWRHRRDQAQLGVGLLAVLLFAGTLLVIAPAAALLAGS